MIKKRGVLASYYCSNILPQIYWLKNTHTNILSYSSRGRSPISVSVSKIKHHQGCFLLETLGENLLYSFQLLEATTLFGACLLPSLSKSAGEYFPCSPTFFHLFFSLSLSLSLIWLLPFYKKDPCG